MELLPSFWPHRAIALGAFVWFGKRGSLTRRPLLPLNAGTAEPVRVSPPEAVAYLLELGDSWGRLDRERIGTWWRLWGMLKDELAPMITGALFWKEDAWVACLKVLRERPRRRK